MFLSEAVARAIHADRQRDLERAARDHRLLAAADEPVPADHPAPRAQVAPATKQQACGDSAGLPA